MLRPGTFPSTPRSAGFLALLFAGFLLIPPTIFPNESEADFQLVEAEVVAFAGGTNMVNGVRAGHLESALTRTFVTTKPKFRDMSWEGDTVFKQSTVAERWRKGAFGDWAKQLERVGATRVFAQFGQFESLRGTAGLDEFIDSYNSLLDAMSKRVGDKLILLSPTPFEKTDDLQPDLSLQNADLARYVEAIRKLAAQRKIRFVDLFSTIHARGKKTKITVNGMHLTPEAHRLAATIVVDQLGLQWSEDVVLRDAIVEKNRLWYEYWRPANWKCLYGDDGNRIFGKAAGDSVPFREEWKRYPGLIETAESRVLRVVDRDSVEAELGSFELPGDLEINLFASETLGVVNPIAMRWDPRGRLWVACTIVYPQISPGDKPVDYIVILEDVDQDGTADRSIRFAEGLNIPTGIELGDGGVYVGQGTELIHLRDTTGDDRADERRVVLTGFGNGDSHQTVNSFVWSPGGELYFCQGDGIESRVETPWGISSLFQAGAWRFRPRRLQLEGLLDDFMGPGNPWGIAFDDWGQSILIDGAGGISFLTPAFLSTTSFLKLPRIGKPGGYCGIDAISTAAMPADYQGDFVIGDYHKNMVSRFAIRPAGSGFSVHWKDPIVRSKHRSFRPVDLRSGPDGAIYIADWYNPIICHQDVSYRHPDRDKTHGRIWRVTSKTHRMKATPHLDTSNTDTLVMGLKHQERWIREQTKRALTVIDREEAVRALNRFTAEIDENDPRAEYHRFQALGAYETIEVVAPKTLARVLESEDYRLRAYAARVVGRWYRDLDSPLDLLSDRVRDPEPLVRMDAIIACGNIPLARSVEVAAMAADHEIDRFINYALTQVVRHLRPHWMQAFERGELSFGRDSSRLAAVLERVKSDKLRDKIKTLALSRELSGRARLALIRAMLSVGKEDEFSIALSPETYTTASEYDESLHVQALAATLEISRQRDVQPGDHAAAFIAPLLKSSPENRRVALEAIGDWGLKSLEAQVIGLATGSRDRETRIRAHSSLGQLGGEEARELLRKTALSAEDTALRASAIAGLCHISINDAADTLGGFLKTNARARDVETVVDAFLGRQGGSAALTGKLGAQKLSPEQAELFLNTLSSLGRNDRKLMSALRAVVGASSQTPEHSSAVIESIASDIVKHGDPSRGELVFRSAATNCYACHRIGGSGGWAGPDLSAIGTTLPIDRIIEEVLWPSKHIKEGYTAITVVTKTGQVHQGYESKSKRSDDSLRLKLVPSGELLTIPVKRIASKSESGSVMPDGLTNSLSRSEMLDLLRFLTELGRPGPFTSDSTGVIRTWETATAKTLDADFTPSKLADADWIEKFSRVAGQLELDDAADNSAAFVLARTQFEVVHAGDCNLRINDVRGLRLWLNGRELSVAHDKPLQLTEGSHQLLFVVDRKARMNKPLRARWTNDEGGGRIRQGPEKLVR